MNKMNDELYLVGHLQVMDEPLSSLYVDPASGRYYLLIRLYVNVTKPTFLVVEASLSKVLEYMKQEIGLIDMFNKSKIFLYSTSDYSKFIISMLMPLSRNKALHLLKIDGIENLFDKHLSHKYVALKNYINRCLIKTTHTA